MRQQNLLNKPMLCYRVFIFKEVRADVNVFRSQYSFLCAFHFGSEVIYFFAFLSFSFVCFSWLFPGLRVSAADGTASCRGWCHMCLLSLSLGLQRVCLLLHSFAVDAILKTHFSYLSWDVFLFPMQRSSSKVLLLIFHTNDNF